MVPAAAPPKNPAPPQPKGCPAMSPNNRFSQKSPRLRPARRPTSSNGRFPPLSSPDTLFFAPDQNSLRNKSSRLAQSLLLISPSLFPVNVLPPPNPRVPPNSLSAGNFRNNAPPAPAFVEIQPRRLPGVPCTSQKVLSTFLSPSLFNFPAGGWNLFFRAKHRFFRNRGIVPKTGSSNFGKFRKFQARGLCFFLDGPSPPEATPRDFEGSQPCLR